VIRTIKYAVQVPADVERVGTWCPPYAQFTCNKRMPVPVRERQKRRAGHPGAAL